MQRAIDCVNSHLADSDFDQPRFAEEMHDQQVYLYKKLKSLTGLNTSALVRNVRLKQLAGLWRKREMLFVSPNLHTLSGSVIPSISVFVSKRSSTCCLPSI